MKTPATPHRGPVLRALLAIALVALVAACSGGGSPSPTPAPGVTTAEEAVSAIRARVPLFDGIDPLNPDMIGQSAWWEAAAQGKATPPVGWDVTFTIGWGDCEAGCIDRHQWVWSVAADGTVAFTGESGSLVTDEILAGRQAASTATGVAGRVGAGPTCPVERPGDPACAPRMVSGAVLVVQDEGGKEIARITTDGSGLFRLALPAGTYTLVPQAVEGYMGTAAPVPFTVAKAGEAWLDVSYDTGIR